MKKVIVVFGFGPGISTAVAKKFGAEGFTVALVSRNRERLDAGVAALAKDGIEAAAFTADASDAAAVKRVIDEVRTRFGSITAIEWTAYGSAGGDVMTASTDDLRSIFDISIVGLITAIQTALPDLKKSEGAAVLVTNGGLGFFDPAVDRMGVEWNAMGLSMANSAKHKLVGMLSHKLKSDGVFVGEVMVTGMVKGTLWDQGNANIDPADVAAAFWKLYAERSETLVKI